MSLYNELKRRSVVRVGAAYLAVAWLVLQVLNIVRDIFTLPDWIGKYVFFALILGFPVALVLAWVYELTPGGIKAASDIPAPQKLAPFGRRNIDFVIIGALSLVIVSLVVDRFIVGPNEPGASGPPMVSKYTKLTKLPIMFPPVGSQYPIVADESRLYFPDWETRNLGLRDLPQPHGSWIPPRNPQPRHLGQQRIP